MAEQIGVREVPAAVIDQVKVRQIAARLLTALRSGIPPHQIRRAIIDATTRD